MLKNMFEQVIYSEKLLEVMELVNGSSPFTKLLFRFEGFAMIAEFDLRTKCKDWKSLVNMLHDDIVMLFSLTFY